jgi:hypothetical protein
LSPAEVRRSAICSLDELVYLAEGRYWDVGDRKLRDGTGWPVDEFDNPNIA